MISKETFEKKGVSQEEEKTPIDILGAYALTTREVAEKLTASLPEGYKKITYSCAKQKLIRLEAKDLVKRKKVDGIIHWIKNEGNKDNKTDQ